MAGQREWGGACQQLGIPRFPQDFPDCRAAAELAQLLGDEHVRSLHLLPPIPQGKLRHCATSTFLVMSSGSATGQLPASYWWRCSTLATIMA